MSTREKLLTRLYYSPGSNGALGGADRLFRAAKSHGISRREVQIFLKKQQVYTLHRPARRRYERQKTLAAAPDAQWQADLVDMQELATFNDGYRYLITVIDVFSRYAWVVPVRNKTGPEVAQAFDSLIQSAGRVPSKLQTDKGKEFFNRHFNAVLANRDIKLFATHSDVKAAIVERFNRTLKQRMWTFFTANRTRRYVEVLPKLVSGYNRSFHRSLGTTPEQASLRKNSARLWQLQYGNYLAGHRVPAAKRTMEPGTTIRLSKQKATFEKGYLPNWTREVFSVKEKRMHPGRVVYKVDDSLGEPIEGIFYPEEIQEFAQTPEQQELFEIERVIQKRFKNTPREQWLVKWLGWPPKFNSWVSAKDIEK